MISASFLAHRGVRAGFLVAAAMLSGYLAAKASSPPSPIVITIQPSEVGRSGSSRPASGFNVTAPAAQSGSVQVTCSQPSPDSAWTCQDGYWQPPEPLASGGGRGLWTLGGTADVAAPAMAEPSVAEPAIVAPTATSEPPVPPAETKVAGYVPMVESRVIPVTVIPVPTIEVPVIPTPTIPTPTVVIRTP